MPAKPKPEDAPQAEAPPLRPDAQVRADVKAYAEKASADGKLDPAEIEALANRCDTTGVRRQVADVLRNALREAGEPQLASLRLAAQECDRTAADYPKVG